MAQSGLFYLVFLLQLRFKNAYDLQLSGELKARRKLKVLKLRQEGSPVADRVSDSLAGRVTPQAERQQESALESLQQISQDLVGPWSLHCQTASESVQDMPPISNLAVVGSVPVLV